MARLKYKFGGSDSEFRELEISDDMIVVRTVRPGPIDRVITTKTAHKTLARFEQKLALPDVGVTVLKAKPDNEEKAEKVRDGARKSLSRLKNFKFAGRALRDPLTKEAVIYTENLFVKFKDSMTEAKCKKILNGEKLGVKRMMPFAKNAYFVEADGHGLEVFDIANRLTEHADVEACHPELIRERKFRGANERQWHLKKSVVNGQVIDAHANVVAAWSHATGAGVTIAVIDDGVDIDHEEFRTAGKVVAPLDASLGTNDPRPKDPYSHLGHFDDHGTACAGVACASGIFGASGVAPAATLMPIRLSSNLGSMEEAEAIYHAVNNEADIISCSWGPSDGKWWDPTDPIHHAPYDLPYSTLLALQHAVNEGRGGKGCVIVWAAGNGNESADLDGYASSPLVISVAACNDTGKRSVYSDYGDTIWCAFPSGDSGHAPFGHPEPLTDGIWTTDRSNNAGYNPGREFAWEPMPKGDDAGHYTSTFGGTSSSTPGVAGLAALLLEREPTLTWKQVRKRLRESCDVIDPANGQYGANGHSPYYGYGRPDAMKLIGVAPTPLGRLPAAPVSAAIAQLRTRSADLFITLRKPAAFSRSLASRRPAEKRFSHFDEAHQQQAMWIQLGFQLSMESAGGSEANKLSAALDFASRQMRTVDPESVRHALAVFTTHDPLGRLLLKPRSVHTSPSRFARSARARGTIAPHPEQVMDYWREDALANEHHEHWHQVYPNQGIIDQGNAQSVLGTLGWQAVIDKFTVAGDNFRAFVESLTGEELRALFLLNDRHGELFIYMHQQMLARYDAERSAVGLAPVEQLNLETGDIDVGYQPPETIVQATGFKSRPPNTTLLETSRVRLKNWTTSLSQAIEFGVPVSASATKIPLTIETFGRAIEATDSRQTDTVNLSTLGNLHNAGHGAISALSGPDGGVMSSTETAIRDPAFWRWHKLIDNLAENFQNRQPPFTYEDRPPVHFAHGEMDLGLVLAPQGHDDIDADEVEASLGALPTNADLGSGSLDVGDGLKLDRILTTFFKSRELEIPAPDEGLPIPGAPTEVQYLTHEPFGYAFRVMNDATASITCTFRVFLCQASQTNNPRSWIEMDRVVRKLQPGSNSIFQADVSSSVINKPAEDLVDPVPPTPPGVTPGSICDCGWPYTLLIPRGHEGVGADYVLAVAVTDTSIDVVDPDTSCGSMSFCGATDRYPDAREMGYPFSRPFPLPILDVIQNEPQMQMVGVTIKHDADSPIG